VFFDQARAGVLKDITTFMQGEWADSLSPAGVKAFTYDGKVYGAPMKTSLEILWYNKALLEKAGVDPASLGTWKGFLEAVKKCKAAGITPLATGGGDKWPLHFYWTMLALRIGGQEAFESAFNRTGEGFDSPAFVKAGEMFKELIDLQPFQPGFLGAKYPDAAGYFGDGKAAMFFMGDFLYAGQKTNSQSGKGIPDDQLDFLPFPAVEGGKGSDAILGAVEGWLVSKGAPDDAVKFLRFFLNKDNQTKMAAAGIHIPLTKGAEAALTNPFYRRVAELFNKAPYLQIVYDQLLGANVGRVVNDVSADLAAGATTPKEAAQAVQEAWESEK
jgi:raffinose/stachyose/melibiose transport system substrate-binding protein